jgi:predicted lipoprotein with Yx(FWY)xxD motif
MRIKTLLTALLAVAATTVFAVSVPFASGATAKAAKSEVVISAKSVSGLGKILVGSNGKTLYMFVPDKQKQVTCFNTCAKIWPPVFLPAGAKLVASGGVKQSLLGSDKDKAGGRVVTYNGWPLYGYLGDVKPGTAYGQATDQSGGYWYVLSTSGAVIKHKASTSTTTTTTTSSSTTAVGSVSTSTTSSSTSSSNGACPNGQDSDNDGDQNDGGPDDGDGCI